MIFNLSNFNSGNILTQLNQVPTPSTYSKISIFGSATVDDLHGVSRIYTQTEINNLDLYTEPTWGLDTFILAKFNNNLQAGNIVSLPSPITKWIVLRKGKNDAKFTKLAEIEANDTTYIDRLAKSKEEYTYQLIPVAGDLLGTPLQTVPIDTSFKKIVLLDPDTEEGYSFCLDLRMSDIQIDEDVSYKDTRGKYQTELRGNKKVNNGSIGFLAKSSAVDSTELEQDLAYLQAFEDFINNGQPKILKIDNGYIYKVATSNFGKQRRNSVNNNGETLFNLTFNWREIGEVI